MGGKEGWGTAVTGGVVKRTGDMQGRRGEVTSKELKRQREKRKISPTYPPHLALSFHQTQNYLIYLNIFLQRLQVFLPSQMLFFV